MNWRGRTIAVCASGPSLTAEVAAYVRALGVLVIVTNDTWQRIPTADVLFAANAAWWRKRRPQVSPTLEQFAGERICCEFGVAGTEYVPPRRVPIGGNSALRACHLAEERGAARILLFGVDLREDELTHWHGLHQGLANPTWMMFKRHRTAWEHYAQQAERPEILNCNGKSSLECFPKQHIPPHPLPPLPPESEPHRIPKQETRRPPVLLFGMHGIGDNLHERAIVRELMRTHEVWLKTSWPQLYWDLVPALHLLPLASPIAWMAKNERRHAALYGTHPAPAGARVVRCAYPWADARATSVLGAMAKHCGVKVGDFSLPIAPAWAKAAQRCLDHWQPTRPLLITRPLLEISDRNPRSAQAKRARNPDHAAYAALYALLRERYFVVSVADTVPGVEWTVGPRLDVDLELHRGELDLETLAALTARAALVYTSPNFLTVLAQAVGTPLACVFGGFEGANSFSTSPTPWLAIEPDHACRCWNWNCKHDKTIDHAAAAARIEQFQRNHVANPAHTRDAQEPARAA